MSTVPTCPTAVSPIGLRLIKSFESCRLSAYLPTPGDRPTIGWGATYDADGQPVCLGQRTTQPAADAQLAADVAARAAAVRQLLAQAPTSQPQFDALVALGYNIGIAALARSAVLRHHLAGDFAAAAAGFAAWRFQHGAVLPGLVRRRAAEAACYREAGR